MELSVPKEESGHSFTHFGSGDMLDAPGGTVNKSSCLPSWTTRMKGFCVCFRSRTSKSRIEIGLPFPNKNP